MILCPSLYQVTRGRGKEARGGGLMTAARPWDTVFLCSPAEKLPRTAGGGREEKAASRYTEPAGALMKAIKYPQPGKKKRKIKAQVNPSGSTAKVYSGGARRYGKSLQRH